MSNDDKLTELERKITSLRSRLEELEVEANKWKAERDRLNELVKGIRAESAKHREDRDSSNGKIAEIKDKIDALRERVRERRTRLQVEGANLLDKRGRLPHRRKMAERLSRIEWEMMTTPTVQMLNKEKELINEAKGLEEGLIAHEKLDKKENGELAMYADVMALEMNLRDYRNEIDRIRAMSNDSHEKMIILRQKVVEEKKRADEAHAKFKERLEAKKVILSELKENDKRARELRSTLGELDRSKTLKISKALEERKKELQAEAKHKLDSGKKLSLEELKLIYEFEEEEDEKE